MATRCTAFSLRCCRNWINELQRWHSKSVHARIKGAHSLYLWLPFRACDTLLFHFVALTHHVLIACFVVAQVTSPTGQLVSSVPLEQTPAEEESRKSISRSFKGTMASSTERKFLFVIYEHTFGVCCGGWLQSGFLIFACFGWFFPSACEDVLTPAAVADSALKVLTNCLATMPAGMFMHKIVAQPLFFVVPVGLLEWTKEE